MSTVAAIPGLSVTAVPRSAEPSPLRSDVASFVGRTQRGPVMEAIRVEGWRHYLQEFGGLIPEANTPFALRGYFENGGEVAYVIRLGTPSSKSAKTVWIIGALDPVTQEWLKTSPIKGGFQAAAYLIEASSPGAWANPDNQNLRISIRYRQEGGSSHPEVDITISADGEPTEYLMGLNPNRSDQTLEEQVAASSVLIRLIPLGPKPVESSDDKLSGPRSMYWENISLIGGDNGEPVSQAEYSAAIEKFGDQPEIALVALPDLHTDIVPSSKDEKDNDVKEEILTALMHQAEMLKDRLILVDMPEDTQEAESAINWLEKLRSRGDTAVFRSAAAYHPHLLVPNPFGSVANPLRTVPPCGHVAGLISKLDRQRGAHHTPANAELVEAIDVLRSFTEAEQARLLIDGINPVRCFPGRGIQVWGGRTLASETSGRFIAHRRLIHRLVRAIRRIAEPLVFNTNGPELWLTLARAVTTVLLEAFRAGALKGTLPDEAFQVRCDDKTNTFTDQHEGCVFCEIDIAPAVPMEFISIRIALSEEGKLEVFES
jgi:phage tail sheath protein FI